MIEFRFDENGGKRETYVHKKIDNRLISTRVNFPSNDYSLNPAFTIIYPMAIGAVHVGADKLCKGNEMNAVEHGYDNPGLTSSGLLTCFRNRLIHGNVSLSLIKSQPLLLPYRSGVV